MENVTFHISRFGEYALLVQVKENPSDQLLQWLLDKKKKLLEIPNIEVIHTYNELLIKFLSQPERSLTIEQEVTKILKEKEEPENIRGVLHRIPVCYESDYGVDIEYYSKKIGVPIAEVIELHTKPLYTIYFLGFLPGFPYLEGLDKRLFLDRKSIPSRKIYPGSIGIGGGQTGVYPQESPGGWHIIGQTPLTLFDSSKEYPSPFMAGDTLQFYAIDSKEFIDLSKVTRG